MGLGHLYRSFGLAQMLQEVFNVTFYCKYVPSSFIENVIKVGIPIIRINDEFEFYNSLNETDYVVLDGYHFDTRY